MNSINTKKGFTLIELIVVTAIVLSVTGVGTVSYLNYNEKQTLEQSALTIKNNLRLAQQNAISRITNEGVCAGKEMAGWCFSPSSSTGNQYKIYGSCTDPDDFALIAPGIGVPPVPVPNPGSVETFTQYSDEEQVVELPRGTTLMRTQMNSFVEMSSGSVLPAGVGQRIMFLPEGDVYIRVTQGANTWDNQTDPRPEKIIYCLEGLFPSLSEEFYKISVTIGGEIIDEGFQADCP